MLRMLNTTSLYCQLLFIGNVSATKFERTMYCFLSYVAESNTWSERQKQKRMNIKVLEGKNGKKSGRR